MHNAEMHIKNAREFLILRIIISNGKQKIIFVTTEMKDIEPHCAVILWFYSPVLQIISFYLPTLPQSDFLKDTRDNFTSCNIIIQKKGCKLTKAKRYEERRNKKQICEYLRTVVSTKRKQKSKTKHIKTHGNFTYYPSVHTRPKYIISVLVVFSDTLLFVWEFLGNACQVCI